MLVAGADVWKGAWIVVVLQDGRFARALTADAFGDVVAALPDAEVIAVDMPIDLPAGGSRRPSDDQAREFVGVRRSSVFPTPPAELLDAKNVAEANQLAREAGWPGISPYAFALGDHIKAVAPLAASDSRIREVHPEVSFREALQGELEWSKASWNGLMLRRRVLESVGIILPDDLGKGGEAGASDVLDAAIAAWSAHRIATGVAKTFPAEGSHIGAIWR